MKTKIISILGTLLAISFLACSCKNEKESMEQWFLKHVDSYIGGVSRDMSMHIHTASTSTPHEYEGKLSVEQLGISVELGIILQRKFLKRDAYFTEEEFVVESKLDDWKKKVDNVIKLQNCRTWTDLRDFLTGDYLSRWRQLDQEYSTIFDNYWWRDSYSRYSMDRYNNLISTKIQPFLDEIGARNVTMHLITEEERIKAYNESQEYWRKAIKKARNKWVDDNPYEARRRGITKF